jgi:Holliday junction resolvase
MNLMRESKYQSLIIKKMEDQGWYVIKLITTNKNGIPDLLCVKGNDVKFIEVKAKKGKLKPLQEYRINELKSYNINVEVAFAND